MPFGNCPANGESFCAALITAVNVEQRLFLMLQYVMYEEVHIYCSPAWLHTYVCPLVFCLSHNGSI